MRATRRWYYMMPNHGGKSLWGHRYAIHEAERCTALTWCHPIRITQKQAQRLLDKGWRICKRCGGMK